MTTSPTYGFLTAFGSHDAHAYVKSGGAVIDTSGVDIMIAMPLEEDTSSTGGGLTKIGDGALVLTGASTYTGVTTIEQGTLRYLEAASASSSFVVKENTKLTGYTLGTSMPPIENFVPATIVENNGTIAPGTVGRTMYMNALNLADGAKLDFKTAAGGQCDGLWILGDVLPSGTTTPAVITVSYTGTVNVPTTLIACQGTLSSDVHFQLPSGLPKLDSEDGINTPILLETNSGVYGSVILKPGGPIADPVWNVFAGGTYSTPDKWSTNSVPNGGGQRAMFTGMLGFGTINVSLNTSPQLSSMVFDSPFGESYSIAPTGTNAITLHSTMAQNWHISLLAGTHAVAANLKLQAGSGESTIRLADNSKLTLSGVLSDETTAANVNVVGNFNGGTLANSVLALSGANTYTGKTTVTNAVLEIASLGVVANANPLGKSSVDPANFVLDNSTLHYTGTAAVSTDRGMTLAGANVKFQMDGNASVSGNIVTGTTVPNVEKTGVGALTLNDTVARTNTLGGLVLVSQGNLNFAGGTDTVYSMDILSLGVEGGSAVTVNQTSGTVSLPSASSSYVMVGMDAPATYNMTGGKLTLAANRMVYLGYADATTTGGTGIMNVSGASEITAEGFIVGWSGTDNAGVLNQSGGTISLSGGARTTNAWSQTIGNNAYGCANISGGTLQYSAQTGGNAYIGAHNTGIMNITGGTFETVNSTNFYVGGDGTENPGYGLINVSGGSFKMRQEDAGANDGWALILGIPGTAVLNVSGTGLVDLQGSETTVKSYLFVGARDAATGIINLGAVGTGGGTIKNAAYVKRITGSGTVNFHGGTLVASEAADPFGIGIADSYMDNLTNAYIYPEGAKVSVEADHAAIIAQVLEDPTGNGLTNASITLADGGSGYVATPLVTISGGGGTGATANAVIDAGGYVTGIVITNPGVGYLTAPDIVISGGGGTGALAAGNDSHFVANVGGAFTKLGEGTLTLTGANTYTGDTIVEAGTLNIANLSTPNATVYVGEDGTLNCSSIVADTLNIGALPTAGAMVAVPEPGSLALLALAGLAIAGAYLRRR
jgi:autotransporter-associated beta strand protein